MSEDTAKVGRADASIDRAMMPRADKDAPEGGPRARGKRRRKVSYLTTNKIDHVDYKEVNILRRFLNDRGKIIPSRQSGNTAKQQRMISEAIHRAREMALLPFVVSEMGTDRREFGPRRERYGDRGPRRNEGAPEQAPQQAAE
jgi:small subunit ribosomal protein S18